MTSPTGSSITFSGLASGLDTSSVVTQLMAIASQPQTQLKSQLTASQQVSNAYQAILAKLSAITTAALGLGATSTTNFATTASVWSSNTVSSSSANVAASAGSDAIAGSALTFDVTQVARSQVSTVAAASNGVVVSDPATTHYISLTTADGTPQQVDISATDGSATAVAAAINAKKIGIRASVVSTDSGQVLQLASTRTGTAYGFTGVTGFDATVQTAVAAKDAQIVVGDPASGGYTVSSSTNTFTGVAPGVTFTVSAPTTGVTLTVNANTDAMTNGAQAIVDSVNAALTSLDGYTGKGDLLQSDSTVNAIATALRSLVSQGDGTASFADYGIQLSKDGSRLAFDSARFTAAFQSDPAGTQKVVTDLAQALSTRVDKLSDLTTGSITVASQSLQTAQTRLSTEISDWDARLAQQKQALQARFTAMESVIQKLNSQGSYLTSIFSSLNGTSSSTSKSS